MDVLTQLKKIGSIIINEPLVKHATFKIGGPAKYFCQPKNERALEKLIKVAKNNRLPFFILGGGSNLLFSDQGFAGLVIKMPVLEIKVQRGGLYCPAGAFLALAVKTAGQNGLTGLEWASGIPGTVGGAVIGNAGAYGGEMKDAVSRVLVLRNGKRKILKNSDCAFAYRQSIFKKEENKDIILAIWLKLKKGEKKAIIQKIKEVNQKRRGKFDQYPCAGSIFKNIELTAKEIKNFKEKFSALPEEFVTWRKIPAGWLVDQCALRGKKIGQAMVAQNHGNIIVNLGGATAENVMMLISIIKQKVRSRFGAQLMEEIRYVGF